MCFLVDSVDNVQLSVRKIPTTSCMSRFLRSSASEDLSVVVGTLNFLELKVEVEMGSVGMRRLTSVKVRVLEEAS